MRTRRTLLVLAAVAAAVAAARRLRRFALRDRVVVIFGGSRGLGLALARELMARGAHVALVARTRADLENARERLHEWVGQRPLIFEGDVTDPGSVEHVLDGVVERCGGIDVLVNDAGVMTVGPRQQMTHEAFERSLATHVWGPLHTMQTAIPLMRRRGGGRIVNIGSIGGRLAFPHLLPYTVGKFALVGLSDGMRAELAREGIRVTTVSPGLMRTGSQLNAKVTGQHRRELAWFSVLGTLPVLSMSARRAARRIVKAIENGERELTLGLPAKLAVVIQALAPELTAATMSLVNRMLPAPPEREQIEEREGWQARSRWVPSRVDRAARTYNELRGQRPV